MKRLSQITESIWSDIQKRSSGESVRKEDEVDNLDRDGFYDYLLSHYDIKVSSFKPINDEVMDCISIPLSYDVLVRMITFDFKHNIIYVPMGTLYYKDLFLNTARNFFVTADSDDNPVNYIINPKDKSKPTNTFFLNVLDFLIKEINDKTLLIHKSVNESIWSDIQKRSSGETIRKEDIPEQDYEHWWRNIPIGDAPKYKSTELRLYDFLYDLIIWPLEKVMNIQKPNVIRIFFKYEDAWYLSIYHNTSHGADNYTMEANGTWSYNPTKYSEMSIQEKRSIKYRLETKKFYVYKYSNEYALREVPEFDGEKGVPLK